MSRTLRMIALSGMLCGVSGCAGYSSVINAFAPAKQKPQVQIDQLAQSSGSNSELCQVPPPPPKKAEPVREIYMVMPEEGGRVGTVAVTFNDGNETLLHGHYSAMALAGDERRAYVGNQQELQATFGSAVSALPKAPMSATLYFVLGKDRLTPASAAEAERIYAEFAARQAPEVWVVGYTDTVGSETQNQALSVKRAEKVRQSLIGRGVPGDSIQASGRGERELLVPTPDNTKEPKNRRVEISVR